MPQIFTTVFTCLVLLLSSYSHVSAITQEYPALNQPSFIENKGQFSPNVLFTARTQSTTIWITTTGIVYDFHNQHKAVPMEFPSINSMKARGNNPLPGVFNQFTQNLPITNIRRYAEVLLENIADGIDMRWYFDKGNPRYDFIIHQYSKPSDFSFTLGNVDNVYTKPNGDLSIQIDNQLVEQKGLIAYQLLRGHTKKYIPCEFKVNNLSNGNWKIGFTVGTYDLSHELVIDPIVVGSFFGSIGNDKVNDIKVDESGYIYIGGTTSASNELPNTLNKSSYSQGKLINSKLDGFIAKFSPEGKNLVYYCTIGGSGDDEILSIDLDNSGGVIAGGYTYSDTSKGFPFTVGAPDSILTPGDADGFIAVIKEEGTRLGFCSY